MNNESIDLAVNTIAHSRLNKLNFNGLPLNIKPNNEDEGYAIQEVLHDRLAGRVAGYKIGCTTQVMQDFLNIDQPCAGRILAAECFESPASLPHDNYRRVGVECEIAVRLGCDLPPTGAPIQVETIRNAVSCCMAAIEIVDDRYVDYTKLDAPTLIADDFFGAGCVLGAPNSDWQSLDLAAVKGRMQINGSQVGDGIGAHVMGHPLEALAWLANTLSRRGHGLAENDIVLTGSIVETHWLNAGDQVEVSIDGLGNAAVSFV